MVKMFQHNSLFFQVYSDKPNGESEQTVEEVGDEEHKNAFNY